MTTEHTALATEIADLLGETGERPRAQIARMIGLMGEWWTRTTANVAKVFHDRKPTLRPDGTPRTLGGAFFLHARKQAHTMLDLKQITKRDFFRCFTDRPPTPRTPKASPVKAPKLPRMPAGAHVTAGNVRRQPARAAVPEVYVVRGRAGAGR